MRISPGFAVSLLIIALTLTPACVWGQSTTATPSKAPVTPPPPTYPAATAVVPTLRTYADALAFSRRWKNSTLLVIRDAASNAVARAELVDSGVLRAWLGASLSDAEGVGFVWLDGVPVGGTQRPYTNWAPGRPKAGLTNTAIAMDAASGYWFDVQQASPQPALVSILAREVTQTLPLPEYSFKPASPPTLRTPPWQTAIIIVCTLLILPLVGGTIGLIVWHIRTPFDNKDGFVAPPPADEPPPPLPPLLAKETAVDGIGGKRQYVHEIYRFDDPKKIEETRMQLGQPFKLPELPPEPTSQPPAAAAAAANSQDKPNDAAAPPSGDAPAGAAPTANPGTVAATPADGAAVVSKAPDGAAAPTANPAPADSNAAAPADEETTLPPAAAEANDEAAEQANADADEGGDANQAQEEEEPVADAAPVAQVPPAAAGAAKLSLPPPPVARKLPAATPLGAPPAAAAPAARKLPAASPIGTGAAPVAARTLPGSKAIGQPSAAAPKRPGPPVGAAPKGPQPIPIAKGPGAKGPVGMPGPSSPPKAPMGGKVGGAAPKAKSAAPSALPTAKTARTLPPARRL